MIIDERYFTNPATRIAGIDIKSDGRPTDSASRIIDDIRAYIERYEPLFIRMLLGVGVSDDIDKYPHIKQLLAQQDRGTSVIAKYVYFFYCVDHSTFNTVAGEKIKIAESSRICSPGLRLTALWNSMVDECWTIVNKIDEVDIHPSLNSDIFEKINTLGL